MHYLVGLFKSTDLIVSLRSSLIAVISACTDGLTLSIFLGITPAAAAASFLISDRAIAALMAALLSMAVGSLKVEEAMVCSASSLLTAVLLSLACRARSAGQGEQDSGK